MFDDFDTEVAEIAAETGRNYLHSSWRGWTDRNGRWNPHMHCPAREQERLNRLVVERKLQKQEQALRQEQEAQAAQAAQEALEGVGAEDLTEEEGEVAGGAGRRLSRSPFVRTTFGHQAAGMFTSMLATGTNVLGAGMGMALAPLGATGGGVTRVATSLLNLLVSAVGMLGTVGAGVLSAAVGAVFATAIGAAGGLVFMAVGQMFGRIGQTIIESMQGVAQVVRDVITEAVNYARAAMQMVYLGGQTPGEAVGLISTLGAFGVSPQQTAGMFGTWGMRPEFLAARMAVLGGLQRGDDGTIDWPATLRSMRESLRGAPDLVRFPMLQAALGPAAANALMPLMMMEGGAFERALGAGQDMAPGAARIRELVEELAPLQAQVGLLATTLKVELASAALEPVLALMRALLDLVREHRGAISGWLQDLPGRLAEGIARAAEYGQRFVNDTLPRLVSGLERAADVLEGIWRVIEQIGGFILAHPTLAAVLTGAALGRWRGGLPGALVGGMAGGGLQVGGVGGGLLGLLGGVGLLRGGTALATGIAGQIAAMSGPETLAFPLAEAGGLGLAGVGAASLPYLLALLLGVGIPLVGSGVIPAWLQARRGARGVGEQEQLAAQMGAVTYRAAAAALGPEALEWFEEHGADPGHIMGRSILAQYNRMREAQRGSDTVNEFLQTIRDRMAEIAENTSPSRVRQNMREHEQEAGDRERVLRIQPSREFEAILEGIEIQRAWRGLQVVLG